MNPKPRPHAAGRRRSTAAAPPGDHEAVVLDLGGTDIIGVRIKGFEHRIDADAHEICGLDVVHIISVYLAVEFAEYVKIFGDLEVVVARGGSSHKSGSKQHHCRHKCQQPFFANHFSTHIASGNFLNPQFH